MTNAEKLVCIGCKTAMVGAPFVATWVLLLLHCALSSVSRVDQVCYHATLHGRMLLLPGVQAPPKFVTLHSLHKTEMPARLFSKREVHWHSDDLPDDT
jgi:hypothetical protein